MAALKWIFTVLLTAVTFIFSLITLSGNLFLVTENVNEVIPYLERNFEKCPKLDGQNEWRQYHYWLNKKLGLLPNTDLTTTLLQLNSTTFPKLPVPKQRQNLSDYRYFINPTEYHYENRYHIQLYIIEQFNGK